MSILRRILAAIWRDIPSIDVTVDVAVEVNPQQPEPAPQPPPPPREMLRDRLARMAAWHKQETGETLDWQASIVDLMKLVGVDPSLANRRHLALEFGYSDIFTGSAADNLWLKDKFMTWLDQ